MQLNINRTIRALLSLLLLRLCPLLLLASRPGVRAGGAWTHGWARGLDSQFIDFGYQLMSSSQASFVASHYSIVAIEKCWGYWNQPSLTTEQGFHVAAQQLKTINPEIKVLLYWNTNQDHLTCYAAAAQLLAEPSWWLRDDSGDVVYVSDGIPMMDTTVAAARDWWAGTPLNGAWAGLMDGVLADGTGSRCPSKAMSAARCQAYVAGRSAMVAELQARLNGPGGGGGIVVGNGIDMCLGPETDNGLCTLRDMDGIMLEHFAVFEQVLPSGRLDVDRVADALARVAQAAAAGKLVVMACWPGPYGGAFDAQGFPGWVGAQAPTTYAGWRAALLEYHGFALAGFLTVAAPSVWMQYQAWYNGFTQGAVPCDDSPSSCAAPASGPWYPGLMRPLGAPLGPAVRAGNVWTRNFSHATSVLDLDDPLASRVAFHDAGAQQGPTTPTPVVARPSTQGSVDADTVGSSATAASASTQGSSAQETGEVGDRDSELTRTSPLAAVTPNRSEAASSSGPQEPEKPQAAGTTTREGGGAPTTPAPAAPPGSSPFHGSHALALGLGIGLCAFATGVGALILATLRLCPTPSESCVFQSAADSENYCQLPSPARSSLNPCPDFATDAGALTGRPPPSHAVPDPMNPT